MDAERRPLFRNLQIVALLLPILLLLLGCGRAPDLIGIDNPKIPVASVENATKRKIFLATTRQPTEVAGAFFSDARAAELGMAAVTVSIPPTHETGELKRPRRLPPDPRKEYAVVDPIRYANDDAFISEINKELAKLPAGNRNVLFFVHGYNNTTSDAVLRLSQFVHDTDFKGVPVLFDWASAAKLTRYVYDFNSALIARPEISELAGILERTNAEGFDIFAHSMGGFLVMEALASAANNGRKQVSPRLRTIVLASPDIDMDLFRSQIAVLGPVKSHLFVLMSEDDGALRVSRTLAGGVPRVGASNAKELAELGVVAIDLSEIDDSSSGNHSKFAGSPEVVRLIGQGLNRSSTFDRSSRASQLDDRLRGIPIRVVFR